MREGEVAFVELGVEDSCSEHSLGRMAHSRSWVRKTYWRRRTLAYYLRRESSNMGSDMQALVIKNHVSNVC